jgi:hypothetical protein
MWNWRPAKYCFSGSNKSPIARYSYQNFYPLQKNTAFDEHKSSWLGKVTCFKFFLHSKVKQYEITGFHDPRDSRVSNDHSAFSITLTAQASFPPS